MTLVVSNDHVCVRYAKHKKYSCSNQKVDKLKPAKALQALGHTFLGYLQFIQPQTWFCSISENMPPHPYLKGSVQFFETGLTDPASVSICMRTVIYSEHAPCNDPSLRALLWTMLLSNAHFSLCMHYVLRAHPYWSMQCCGHPFSQQVPNMNWSLLDSNMPKT